ncbi:Gx transporter family protein [Intestinibacillus massiliensis]|uniref:Gx transporter family protein n=1 Tax=Intestinibacillus massiliensis TaxID=1871029 RepID=UPI000B34AE93|nr:Gx transporter family protein [Intestinibacillus massiliensis]
MRIKRIALCGLFTSLALILSLVERMVPLNLVVPVPGIKLGLANVVTLFALTAMRKREASAILLCRVTLASIFAGSVTSFLFSLFGGFLALGVMALLLRREGRWFSLFGISVAGAAAHNIGQVCAAMLVLGTADVLGYLPLLLLTSIPMGLLTGLVCRTVLNHLKKIDIFA